MRLGLALGGGAARGMAHLGVLAVLRQAGLTFDCISGCSAGAIAGACLAAGMSVADMTAMAPFVSWRRLASRAKDRSGLLSFDKLERWLEMMIGGLDFTDLQVPFAVTAMDAMTGERVVLRQGRVARAVRASCSVPGFITPVEVNGRLLYDGGIVDNLPVDLARELGADYVIAVDIFEPTYGRGLGPLGPGITAIETLVRYAGGGFNRADFLIAPRTAGYNYIRFSRHDRLIAAGRQAAEARLPELLAELEARTGQPQT